MRLRTTTAGVRRAGVLGFVIGFVVTFVATMLALVAPLFEILHPVLVPAATLLSPLSDAMAGWNGLLTMVLAGVVNGLLYAVGFVLVAMAARAVPQRSER